MIKNNKRRYRAHAISIKEMHISLMFLCEMLGMGIFMQILVDADACPVKDIIVRVAKQYKIAVTMIIDTSHELFDGYSTIITVDKARDSVDIKLINLVKRDDIVVTQDYGVAAMGLGKGAKVINQNGLIYSDNNIDRLLFERHIGQKIRRAGGRTGSIKKRSKENDEAFERAFIKLLKSEDGDSSSI